MDCRQWSHWFHFNHRIWCPPISFMANKQWSAKCKHFILTTIYSVQFKVTIVSLSYPLFLCFNKGKKKERQRERFFFSKTVFRCKYRLRIVQNSPLLLLLLLCLTAKFMYLLASSPERPGGPIGPSSPWNQMILTLAGILKKGRSKAPGKPVLCSLSLVRYGHSVVCRVSQAYL